MSTESPLDFLSGEPAATPAPETQAAAPAAEAAPDPAAEPSGPVRDDKGRFAPKSETPASDNAALAALPPGGPIGQAPTPTPAAASNADDLAKRVEELEKANAGLRSAVSAKRAEAREARKAAPAPDYWTEDDKAYHQAEVTAIQQDAFDRVAQASFNRFSKVNGEELAKEVAAWAGRQSTLDRTFNDALIASDDPVETAYEAFQNDPAQKIKSLEAKIAALTSGTPNPAPANPGATPSTPAPASPPAPKTIANATSVGGMAHVPVGPGEAYRAAFQG